MCTETYKILLYRNIYWGSVQDKLCFKIVLASFQ